MSPYGGKIKKFSTKVDPNADTLIACNLGIFGNKVFLLT